MISEGIWHFGNKRVLLLQGPVGPFFWRLSADLRRAGATVYKVNFNGGDTLFYPTNAIVFSDPLDEWPEFFENLLIDLNIDVIMLFGDCRPIHRVAHRIAARRGVEIGVFEEGYIRPDYISFERFGVNGHSRMPQNPNFYRHRVKIRPAWPIRVGKVFWYAMAWAMMYNTSSRILRPWFPHYRHHRTLTVMEGLQWLRSLWRKNRYGFTERGIQQRLETELSNRFYLVPLQVHNDAQISVHSNFASVDEFIVFVIESFAAHAPKDTVLVIKHHPLDRGFRDYTQWIRQHSRRCRVGGRVIYIHDQHLPALLKHTKGVVVINSTVGLSALHHGAPLKACGKAIYQMEGLTFSGPLDDFWTQGKPPDDDLFQRLRSYIIENTQLNGSFYKRMPVLRSHAGIYWGSLRERRAAARLVPDLWTASFKQRRARGLS